MVEGEKPPKQTFINRVLAPDPQFAVRAIIMIAITALVAVAAIALYSQQFKDAPTAATVWGTALITAGAFAFIGGFLGFMFAVPRLATEGTDKTPKTASPTYRANTNLEQISDWFTKILVGLSLVEFKEIPGLVQRLVDYVKPGLGKTDEAGVFALSLIAYFTLGGFLVGYMATRIYAEKLFTHDP